MLKRNICLSCGATCSSEIKKCPKCHGKVMDYSDWNEKQGNPNHYPKRSLVRGTSKSVLTLDRGACAIKRRSDFLLPAPHAGSPVKSLNLLPRGPVRATFVSRFCGT